HTWPRRRGSGDGSDTRGPPPAHSPPAPAASWRDIPSPAPRARRSCIASVRLAGDPDPPRAARAAEEPCSGRGDGGCHGEVDKLAEEPVGRPDDRRRLNRGEDGGAGEAYGVGHDAAEHR